MKQTVDHDTNPPDLRLVVATTNSGKLREFRAILPATTELVTLSDLGLEGPEETGRSFLENAVLKAQYACVKSGLPAIADDSGLAVDGLSGEPGVRSARFAGPNATDKENNRKLVESLAARPEACRTARFICAVAFEAPGGLQLRAEASLHGQIVDVPRGDNGFGYDPHFVLDDPEATEFNGRTLAELELGEKSLISHRRRALDQLLHLAAQKLTSNPAARTLINDT